MGYDGSNQSVKEALKTYIIGFVLSCVFTLASYYVVVKDVFSQKHVLICISALAIAQAWVQLIYFLHLNRETKPKFRFFVFCFMALVAVLLVGGSLWIMYNLDYRTMGNV